MSNDLVKTPDILAKPIHTKNPYRTTIRVIYFKHFVQ